MERPAAGQKRGISMAPGSDLFSLRGQGIKSRLVLLLLVVLIPVLLIEVYIYYDRFRDQRTQELQANLEIARAVSKAFTTFVEDVVHQEYAIGLAMTSSQPMASEDIDRLLETHRAYEAVEDFSWTNPQGLVLYSSNPAKIGNHVPGQIRVQEFENGLEWAVGELSFSGNAPSPAFCIARSIRNDKAGFLGLVVATVNPDRLDSVLSVERGEGGAISIIDKRGMLVYRYPHIDLAWEQRNLPKTMPEIQRALDGEEVAWIGKGAYADKTRIMASVPIRPIGWSVGAGRSEAIVLEPAASTLMFHAILLIAVMITAFGVALLLARPIIESIRGLREHAVAVGHGELKSPEAPNFGPAELKDLADAFNMMTEKVRRRENALRDREELWRLFIDHAPVALAMFDCEMRYLNASRRWLSDYNLSGRDLIGLSHYDVFPEIPEYWRQIHQRAMAGEVARADMDRFERADGSVQWLRWEVRPWRRASSEIGGIVIFSEDITERKQSEEERLQLKLRLQRAQKAESLARMAGAIAHNFNNILGAAIGNLDLALDDLPQESQTRPYVAQAMVASRRAAEISRFMLTYVGQTVIKARPLDLSEAVREVIPLLITSIPQNVHLETDLPRQGPFVLADDVQVKQMLTNLVLNSSEAIGSREGNITLAIRTVEADEIPRSRFFPAEWEPTAKGYAYLSVSDSGHGLDESTLEKVFDPFFSTRFIGRGLGLPVVLGILRSCKGGITIESQPDRGATFRLYLPLVEPRIV
jgi:PAS domain S-box-containing protein